jgi:hypothetical protein
LIVEINREIGKSWKALEMFLFEQGVLFTAREDMHGSQTKEVLHNRGIKERRVTRDRGFVKVDEVSTEARRNRTQRRGSLRMSLRGFRDGTRRMG